MVYSGVGGEWRLMRVRPSRRGLGVREEIVPPARPACQPVAGCNDATGDNQEPTSPRRRRRPALRRSAHGRPAGVRRHRRMARLRCCPATRSRLHRHIPCQSRRSACAATTPMTTIAPTAPSSLREVRLPRCRRRMTDAKGTAATRKPHQLLPGCQLYRVGAGSRDSPGSSRSLSIPQSERHANTNGFSDINARFKYAWIYDSCRIVRPRCVSTRQRAIRRPASAPTMSASSPLLLFTTNARRAGTSKANCADPVGQRLLRQRRSLRHRHQPWSGPTPVKPSRFIRRRIRRLTVISGRKLTLDGPPIKSAVGETIVNGKFGVRTQIRQAGQRHDQPPDVYLGYGRRALPATLVQGHRPRERACGIAK